MPIFNKKSATPAPRPSLAAIQRRHQQLAENHLDRAAKAGRLEAETRLATLGTGHAVMALLTYLQAKDGFVVPGTAEAAPVGQAVPDAGGVHVDDAGSEPTDVGHA
jgi:hypothetical protein